MRVDDWLAAARALGVDRLDTQLLLAHHLQRPRSWLIAHGDEEVDEHLGAAIAASFARRGRGEPLAYLVGEKEFHGLALEVTSDVLVPRPETELLVDWAVSLLHGRAAPSVVDLGTGSGAIAVALAHRLPSAHVTATDLSAAALSVAARNAARYGARVEFIRGPWWQPLAGRRFDLVVSNPPYVADGDPHLAALRHEPCAALASGPDGLQALREIVSGAPPHLQAEGGLIVEHGHDQGPRVRELLAQAGFQRIETRCDLAGHGRCSAGFRHGFTNA